MKKPNKIQLLKTPSPCARLIIYPLDISALTGKSENYGRIIHEKILFSLGRSKEQALTIEEYCKYFNIKISTVFRSINSDLIKPLKTTIHKKKNL